ncbi:MAG: bifunctional diaminohydroxyphosphoribosylaminopyrimidine deaminase/5-amino-6-(5-phosphoribosylamino)uracil reductase RibD [Deltaproteobacteria bacterium]|nr:bifunctional diaminohydroxyphosphoribosylaminopyrimidine deaminase/5-amino-6-(5-phosphoribosylamino)uracil reductase RibD [Deltaproteobacteria bacterium]
MNDTDYMQQALTLAEKGRGYTSPNPMVGAVVVKDGEIVGRGWHKKAGGPHAEVNAIADAGKKAVGAALYVTLEPCNHQGRTPPCTRAILSAGICRVVVAMADPNPDVAGGGHAYLRAAGVEVTTGVCEKDALRLNEAFVRFVRTKRPFVILKCAATLDGRIATSAGDSKWVTGPESRKYVHELRHAADAIMVGIGTVRSDDPSLTTRIEGRQGKDPVRIILDTRLTISEDAVALRQKSEAKTIIVTGPGNFGEKAARIIAGGAELIEAPVSSAGIDLDRLMEILGRRGISSLLIEGGSRVAASAISSSIVDKVCFFYAPKILGGDGVPICAGPGPALMKDAVPVSISGIRQFGPDFMVEAYIR